MVKLTIKDKAGNKIAEGVIFQSGTVAIDALAPGSSASSGIFGSLDDLRATHPYWIVTLDGILSA